MKSRIERRKAAKDSLGFGSESSVWFEGGKRKKEERERRQNSEENRDREA